MVAAIFHGLLSDLSAAALNLASCLEPGTIRPALLRRLVCVPTTADSAWDFVSDRMAAARPDDCDGRPE
jgi:hypothetical protein